MTDSPDRTIVRDMLKVLVEKHVRRDKFIRDHVGEKDIKYYYTLGFFDGYEIALVALLDKYDKSWRYSAEACHCGYSAPEQFTL